MNILNKEHYAATKTFKFVIGLCRLACVSFKRDRQNGMCVYYFFNNNLLTLLCNIIT